MSFFNKIYNDRKSLFWLYEALYNEKRLELVETDTHIGIDFIAKGASPRILKLMASLAEYGKASYLELFSFIRVVNEGPKIFRPNRFNLEALSHMKLNVDYSEYVQPFDTLIIEFPKEYTKSFLVPNENRDITFNEYSNIPEHEPAFITLYHKGRFLLAQLYFTSAQVLSVPIIGDGSLEELIELRFNRRKFKQSMPITDSEMDVSVKMLRAALNCVLIMEEVGIQKIGPENVSYQNRLLRYNTVAAKKELSQLPIIYSFDQNLKFYRDERTIGNSEPTGRKVCTHWREGHWRQQPYGPGRLGRKRIRIDSILVNKDYFGGKLSDTNYTKEL